MQTPKQISHPSNRATVADMRSSTEIKGPRNDIPDYFPEGNFDRSSNLSPEQPQKSEKIDKEEITIENKASPQKHEMLSFID